MESNGRLGLTLIIGCLVAGAILLMPAYGYRDGYIMNLLLSSMHDVVIDNPLTNQTLTYNGTYWINQNATGGSGGETTECINMASQYQLIVNSTNGNCFVRALANGTGIIIGTNATHATISATTLPCVINCGESNTASNVGSGLGWFKQKSGVDLQFKSVIAGNGITVTDTTDDYTIGTKTERELFQVFQSVTKSNIGTLYTLVYGTTLNDEQETVMHTEIPCSSFTQMYIAWSWDYVGTGSQSVKWVAFHNLGQTDLHEVTGILIDQVGSNTGWIDKPSWCDIETLNTFQWQAKSTVAGDDPVAKGYKIMVR